MIFEIRSSSNQKYKFLRSLKKKKGRQESGRFCVEGIKGTVDAVNSGFDVELIAASESGYEKFYGEIPGFDGDIYVIADNIFETLCDTSTPQGILAVIRMREDILENTPGKSYIYCDHINDPGNLGTIIRTADAGDIDGVLLSPECVDLYSPKTIRSSMGSFFHIPVYENVDIKRLKKLSAAGYRVLSSVLDERAVDYRTADYRGSVVLALGNESGGVSDELRNISDEFVKIPIPGKAESLNVSIAGAIFIYEFVRNR